MSTPIDRLAAKIDAANLKLSVNVERPTYVQPEDRILYRASRVIIILASLNTKYGLSKEIIACIDFLLRNSVFQTKFILEYFKGQKNILAKISKYTPGQNIEIDFNIVQYKSLPWDLRFNDMFLFLFVRKFIKTTGKKPNIRIMLTDEGLAYFEKIQHLFSSEINFMEIFGKRFEEEKTKKIITEVIPNSYWSANEQIDH